MSQNICNICGANYEYRNGRWICPACGAFKAEELSNEEVTLLYNAAQKLRLSDFDEAEKAYSDIIEKFPKNSDGYWGRLLSRYGIKYEDDFDGRKIPTCYATSIESVITDKDYLKAIGLADQETGAYYTLQAEYIERVRKEWVEKAKKEKPYDIFICYKDSDLANGIDRTQDSIAAQELYIHLTEQGYRVFFSRESLRGKVGEKYEPYIFNALSTAKVMLVYGSKSEYITSTWLKNEWTRYEKRLQAGEKKPNSLIVACDGFSPAELPKVLSSMQCFDATSRSFYTDLDAALKRIIKGEEKPKPVVTEQPKKQKSKMLPITLAVASVIIAILLCILLPNLLGDKSLASITDSKYGVVISADSEIFDEKTSLIVDKLTTGAQYTALVSAVNTSKSVNVKNAIIYDIECDADLTKNVTIKVAYSKSSVNSTVKVYYVSDDKSLIEEHGCIYDDGFVEFKTNHLSYYVIGEVSTSNSGSQTTIERVGIRTITFSDKFTAEYVLARWTGGSKSEASIIEIMDQYGAQQGGGKLHIAHPGDFVDEIDEWLFSPERKVGDYAIIENAYGFSLCYISSINPTDNGTGDNVGDDITPPATNNDIIFTQTTKTAKDIHTGQLILVNKNNRYTFPAGVSLLRIYDNMVTKPNGSTIYRPVSTDYKLEAEALQALNNMMFKYFEYDDAATFAISSAYRTLDDQEALSSSVQPGYSDLHTGYCVAIQYSDRTRLESNHWFYQNCYKYGFVVRYPEGKESITGISDYEHCFRYVGIAHATYMYQNGLCLEEYVELLKNNYASSATRLSIAAADGNLYEVYYIAASSQELTIFNVPSNYNYTVSGDNNSGFIVTVKK